MCIEPRKNAKTITKTTPYYYIYINNPRKKTVQIYYTGYSLYDGMTYRYAWILFEYLFIMQKKTLHCETNSYLC